MEDEGWGDVKRSYTGTAVSSKAQTNPPSMGAGGFGGGFDFGQDRPGAGGYPVANRREPVEVGGGLAPLEGGRRASAVASAGEFREGPRTFGMAPANPYGVNQFKSKK